MHYAGRLERLARYVCRPPIAKDRLSLTKSGYVVYKFKKPWRNGREAVVMDPLTFLSRLADAVQAAAPADLPRDPRAGGIRTGSDRASGR